MLQGKKPKHPKRCRGKDGNLPPEDGNPNRKEKMETLMLMYEIETGKKMFVE